jgi:hypothetical protein
MTLDYAETDVVQDHIQDYSGHRLIPQVWGPTSVGPIPQV